jgi:hypothetical protein
VVSGSWLNRLRRACRLPLAALTVSVGFPALGLAAGPAAAEPVTLEQLDLACQQARSNGELQRLRGLQRSLLLVRPAPQPLPVVLANADALLRCGAPDSALVVLNRFSPAPGAEQVQWLLLQWRAAQAALDHRLAAEALRQLAEASGRSLGQLQVPVVQDGRGRWQEQAAVDLLAGHLDALGQQQQAAQLLLAHPGSGVAGAERLAQAVRWSPALPAAERERLLEQALEQAAAARAWGLASELLDAQLALLDAQPSERRRQLEARRRRLAQRIDDVQTLQPQAVRSPRDPGGHAASSQP